MSARKSARTILGFIPIFTFTICVISIAVGQMITSKHSRPYNQRKNVITREFVNQNNYDIEIEFYKPGESPNMDAVEMGLHTEGYHQRFIKNHSTVLHKFRVSKGTRINFTAWLSRFSKNSNYTPKHPTSISGSFSESGTTTISLGIEKLTRTFQNRTDKDFYLTFNSPIIWDQARYADNLGRYRLGAHGSGTFVFPEASIKHGVTFTLVRSDFLSGRKEWTGKFHEDGTTIIADENGTANDSTANSQENSGGGDIDRIDVSGQ